MVLPNFKCLPGVGAHLRGAMSISPSVEYMERAYDEAKYGHFSRRPYIDMVIPSLTDPSVAPPGKHVMSCFVQYAPYNLKEGTWDEKREEFGDTVINTIAEHAPNIKDIILHRQVLTPLDLERDFGLSEGNIFQGELTLEQLFFLRPAPGGRNIEHRSRISTCADQQHIRAAASWARTGVFQNFHRCLTPARAHDAAARMRRRAAHVKILDRRAILRPTRRRPQKEKLLERQARPEKYFLPTNQTRVRDRAASAPVDAESCP